MNDLSLLGKEVLSKKRLEVSVVMDLERALIGKGGREQRP